MRACNGASILGFIISNMSLWEVGICDKPPSHCVPKDNHRRVRMPCSVKNLFQMTSPENSKFGIPRHSRNRVNALKILRLCLEDDNIHLDNIRFGDGRYVPRQIDEGSARTKI